jgi:DNA repair protein RecN (Recombination protein N)
LLRRLRIENLALIREAELEFTSGLNAVTGETGAGKTIFAQAIGLLLGGRGDAAVVGPAAAEAFVEAELEVAEDFFEDEELAALADLRPAEVDGLVLARRVFADGRTRAYAWGRSVAREDIGAAGERLVAMSGQFQQRRLARPAFQLAVLDAFCGDEQLERKRAAASAWRELLAARRRRDEALRAAGDATAEADELEALVADTEGLAPQEEDGLRSERERLRNVTELSQAVGSTLSAVVPEEGDGAASLAAAGARMLAPLANLAPELAQASDELRELALRLQDVGSELHSFAATLEADPLRLETVEARLELISDLRRRFGCDSYEELLARRAEAVAALDERALGGDPPAAAEASLNEAEARTGELFTALHSARVAAQADLGAATAEELRSVGMGDGEFRVELREREPGPTGYDEAVFLVRPNAGLPFSPVAETASGGELSRIALALAAVAGGETLVFDEIDAGIGGETAHRVAETLQRLAARRAQVITITHLPQIASVADAHFHVEKIPGDPTHTRILRLDEESRRKELERMAGGREFIATLAAGESS